MINDVLFIPSNAMCVDYATNKQTMQLKFPENVRMYVGLKFFAKTHIIQFPLFKMGHTTTDNPLSSCIGSTNDFPYETTNP